jgi:hypothetical protein
VKTCTKCEQLKPLDEFHKDTARPDGRTTWCADCRRARRNAWRDENLERERAKDVAAYAAQREARAEAARWYKVKASFNITRAQYEEMLSAQGGGCAICGGVNANGHKLVVDHDHSCCPESGRSCGKCVRGLLCHTCNRAIGMMGDSPERLAAAVTYLRGE